jgi:hypothetical protein
MAWMMPSSAMISSAFWARCTDPRAARGAWVDPGRWSLPADRCTQRVGLLAGLGLLAITAAGRPLHAQSAPLDGTVALASQLVDRGLAITAATPVLQGEMHWSSPAGWALGAAAASEVRSPRLAEGVLDVARSWPLSGNWQMQASLLYYDAMRRRPARPYRRVEADLAWIYRDVLTVNLAALRAIGGRDLRIQPAAEANLRWPLGHHVSLLAGVGVARFQRYGSYGAYGYYGESRSSYYSYGQAGLAWAAGRWRIELDRIATAGAPPPRRATGGLSPWLASVSWSF